MIPFSKGKIGKVGMIIGMVTDNVSSIKGIYGLPKPLFQKFSQAEKNCRN
jgi:hypothetical protein